MQSLPMQTKHTHFAEKFPKLFALALIRVNTGFLNFYDFRSKHSKLLALKAYAAFTQIILNTFQWSPTVELSVSVAVI